MRKYLILFFLLLVPAVLRAAWIPRDSLEFDPLED